MEVMSQSIIKELIVKSKITKTSQLSMKNLINKFRMVERLQSNMKGLIYKLIQKRHEKFQ